MQYSATSYTGSLKKNYETVEIREQFKNSLPIVKKMLM